MTFKVFNVKCTIWFITCKAVNIFNKAGYQKMKLMEYFADRCAEKEHK